MIKSQRRRERKSREEREKSRGLGQRTPAVVGMAVDAPGVKRRAGRPCAWLQGVGYLLGASGAWWLFQRVQRRTQEGQSGGWETPRTGTQRLSICLAFNRVIDDAGCLSLLTIRHGNMRQPRLQLRFITEQAKKPSKTKHTPGKNTHLSTNTTQRWLRGGSIVLTFKVSFQRDSGWWTGVTATHTGRTNPEWGTC